MNPAFIAALEAIKEQVATKEAQLQAELLPLKTTANQLSKLAGLPDTYVLDGAESRTPGTQRTLKFKEDQFFNKPLASSVAAYFEARDAAGMDRPASIDEIFTSLVSGGFKFEGATGSDENSKRALKIALTKNTAQFVKIGEKFALKKWYGMRAPRKPGQKEEDPSVSPTTEVEESVDLEFATPLATPPEAGAAS